MNDAEHSSLTPKERLAISRRALVRELNGEDEADARSDARLAAAQQELDGLQGFEDSLAYRSSPGGSRRWVSMARSMTERWWRRHPAQDRKSTRLNSSHQRISRMPSSA